MPRHVLTSVRRSPCSQNSASLLAVLLSLFMYAQKQGMEHQELKAKLSSSCSQGQKQFQSHRYEDRDVK